MVFHVPHFRGQRGFSLIEVSIVTAIILLVAIIGIPAIGSYVIENKVPKVGEELQRFIARTKTNAQGAGTTPYAGVDTGILANALRDSSVVTVSGQGAAALVVHGLGGNGTAGNGTISLAPAAMAGGGMGSGFSLTLTSVNNAACPALASVMQRVSEIIAVEGSAGRQNVKDGSSNPPVAYSASLVESLCASGDKNTFVFTAR